MNKFLIVGLTIVLAGCASAPVPTMAPEASVEPEAGSFVDPVEATAVQPEKIARNTATLKQARAVEMNTPPANVDAKDHRCLAQALYWEARGEGREGMLAVASVVLNRVEDNRFPNSVCGVVYDGGETPPCQFSWWCDGKSDNPTNQPMWAETVDLANEFLTMPTQDPTDGALFYHATSINRPWRRQLTARIGNHIFYR